MIPADEIHQAKILVVDDCEDNLFMQIEILKMAGYSQVFSCADSSEVLDLHIKNAYDLILLDMHMPGINGLEVMARLREVEKDSYLPVLAITGDRGFKIAALEAGARDFLTKPYDMTEFQMRVRNMLEVRLLYKTVAEQGRMQKEMALHDALTGLPNRRLLVDRIEKAMQHASRGHNMMAVMYLDLDGFKAVNDSLGHRAGDELLVQVARRLLSATRGSDTVARLGGDEFTVLLDAPLGPDAAHIVAARIIASIEKLESIGGVPVRVSASIGLAFAAAGAPVPDATLAEQLLRTADEAMYVAKRSGKGRCQLVDLAGLALAHAA
jgi:two-component system cell cycle response regulator